MARSMDMSVDQSGPNLNCWMKFCADIQGPQMMNLNNFGGPLTFPLVPS